MQGFFVMRAHMTQIRENIPFGLAKSNKDFLIGLLGDLVSWKSYSANFQKLFSHDLEIV